MSNELIDSEDNRPFSSENLKKIVIKSDRFGELIIFPPPTIPNNHGGVSIFESISIKESIFSPIVSGTLIVFDVGNFTDNYNIEGFEDIIISFKKTKNSKTITFSGIITDITLLTNDSAVSAKMNAEEYIRLFSITFMNKDLFLANYTTPQDPPKNTTLLSKDFVGWISKN